MYRLLPLILAAASARAAITVLYPTTDSVWYENNTVTLNWTVSDPATDTYQFRTYLSNQDQSLLAGNHSIADSTNATSSFVRLLLPQLTAGKGYILNLVNTSNEAQIFATSQPFDIEQGTVTNQTSITQPSLAPTGSAANTGDSGIPGFTGGGSSSSSNPFATASAKSSAGRLEATGVAAMLSAVLAWSIL